MLMEFPMPLPRSEEEKKKKERRQQKRDHGEDTNTTKDDDSERVEEAAAYFDPMLGGGDGMVAHHSAVEWEDASSGSDAARLGDEALSPPLMMGPLPYHASQGETTMLLEVAGASPTSPRQPCSRRWWVSTVLLTCTKRRRRRVAPPCLTPQSKGRAQSSPESRSNSRGQGSRPQSTRGRRGESRSFLYHCSTICHELITVSFAVLAHDRF
jgi:hypothetical protein